MPDPSTPVDAARNGSPRARCRRSRGRLACALLLAAGVAIAAGPAARADHTRGQEEAGPADAGEFHLRLRMEHPPGGESTGSGVDALHLSYQQMRPRERALSEQEIEVTEESEVLVRVDFPPPGRLYRAAFNPVVTGAKLDQPHLTRICLRRKTSEASRPWDRYASLRCAMRSFCVVDDDDPGWVSNCPRGLLQGQRDSGGFELIPVAHAAADEKPSWVSPSLQTLEAMPEQDRVGYTRFEIASGPIPRLASAEYFTYAIQVGKPRTSVYIDGWPPSYLHQDFDAAVGLRFAFGLENLNFSGGEDGFEVIAVQLKFFDGNDMIHEVELVRSYAALRDAPAVAIEGELGETYRWTGEYKIAPRQDKYEIFIAGWHTVDEVDRVRRLVDRSGLVFGELPLRGAIRPPLGANPNYGTAVGLQRPTGQIQFTFDEQQTRSLCRFLLEKRTERKYRFIHPTAYVYEMGTGRTPSCRTFGGG